MELSRFPHDYPKGYKQYRLLKEMNKESGLTYTEIIRFAYEMSHGVGSFDMKSNRGYWSGAFVQKTPSFYGSNVTAWIPRLCKKENKLYLPNEEGMRVYDKLWNKFEGITSEDAREAHKEKREQDSNRIEKFKERASGQLSIDQRENMKSRMNEWVDNLPSEERKVITTTSLSGSEIPTKNRKEMGFNIDDEVIFYRNFNKELGDGFIQSIKENSIRISDKIEISIGLSGSTIPQITYIPSEHRFVETSGHEITIALKTV